MSGPLLLPLLRAGGALTPSVVRGLGKTAAAQNFSRQAIRTTFSWLSKKYAGKTLREKLVHLAVGAIKATGVYAILEWMLDAIPWHTILGTSDPKKINQAKQAFADDVRRILNMDGSPESMSERERLALIEYLDRNERPEISVNKPTTDDYNVEVNKGLAAPDYIDVDTTPVSGGGTTSDSDDIAPEAWSRAMVKAYKFWGRFAKDPEELRSLLVGTQQLMSRPEEITRLYNARDLFSS